MTDYTKLVKALRCKRDDCDGCDLAFFDKDEGWMCQYAAKDDDAADAIEALQAEVKRLELDNEDYEYTLRERYDEPKRGDLVEVVRCKDCIHFTQSGWCDREFDWFPVDDMDFCSSAEKMEVQE